MITNVAVLRETGERTGPHDVVLEGGRIASIGPPGAPAPHLTPVDGTGATLLPGLIDVHVHVSSGAALPGHLRVPRVSDNLDALLWAGVTTVFDPALDPRTAARLARRDGIPEIRSAGKPFGAPGGHPAGTVRAAFPSPLVKLATRGMAWEVSTAADVDRAVRAQGETDALKVMIDAITDPAPEIGDAPLARLREAATAAGVPLLAHVGLPSDVDRALAVPVDALVHAPWTGALTPDQADRLAAAGIPVAPTLAVWDASGRMASGEAWRDPLVEAALPRPILRDLDALSEGRLDVEVPLSPWLGVVAAGAARRAENVRLLHERGVTLLLGSDTPVFGLPAGAGTHRELDLLREAGLSPAETLVAATWTNSRFLDPDARFGAVREGWEADLVLVRGDPVTDPDAVHRVEAVWLDGRRVIRR